MQVCTQRYDRRPYGVGLLVAGYDVSLIFAFVPCVSSESTAHFRIKDRTFTRLVQAPTSTTAKLWLLELALKALERIWKSI